MDVRQGSESSLNRVQNLYEYHEKYQQHKDRLREAYKDQDIKDASFKPDINPVSKELARRSCKNFNQRTMDLYLNKHRREERTTDEIEYMKSVKELTFHPKLSNSKPSLDHIYGEKNVSPANQQRNNTYNSLNNKKLAANKNPLRPKPSDTKPHQPAASYDPYQKKQTPDLEEADSYGNQSDFNQNLGEEEQKTLEDYLQHSTNQELEDDQKEAHPSSGYSQP